MTHKPCQFFEDIHRLFSWASHTVQAICFLPLVVQWLPDPGTKGLSPRPLAGLADALESAFASTSGGRFGTLGSSLHMGTAGLFPNTTCRLVVT